MRTSWTNFCWIAGIVIVAMVLRFDRARTDGLTFDELWHVELSTGHGSRHITLPNDVLIERAPAITSLDDSAPIGLAGCNMYGAVHPPLYVLVLKIWRACFGTGDLAAKLLSIACAAGAIILLYDAVKTLTGPTPARWAATLFALAPAQIYLSQQVRGYAMAQLFACGAVATLVRIHRDGPSLNRMIGLTACGFAMCLTHYFAIPLLPALGVFALFALRDRSRRRSLVAIGIAFILFLIVWGPSMFQQRAIASASTDWWLIETTIPRWRHVWLTIGRALAIIVRQIAEPRWQFFHWPLIVGGVAILFAVRRRSWIWIAAIAGTLGFVTILDLTRHSGLLIYPRYTSLAAPAICALIATLMDRQQSLWRHVVPVMAVVYAIVSIPTAYGRDDEPEWAPLGLAIDEHCNPAEPILFYSGTRPLWYHEFLYLGASHYSHQFPRPIVRMTRPTDAALLRSLPSRSVWLISGPLDRAVDQVIPGGVVTEQYLVPQLAMMTRVTLPAR